MMPASVFAMCAAAVVLAGCRQGGAPVAPGHKKGGEQTEGPGGDGKFDTALKPLDAPPVMLQLQPNDHTSQVGKTPLRVVLTDPAAAVPEAAAIEIAERTDVVSWPELAVVPSTVTRSVGPEPGYGPGGGRLAGTAEIRVVPTAELDPDAWYALRVRGVLNKYSADARAHLRQPDGTVLARFSLGSRPALSDIRMCPKGDSTVVLLDFSERVSAGKSRVGVVEVASGDLECDEIAEQQDSAETIRFKCSGIPNAIRIHLTDLRAANGKLVEIPGSPADRAHTLESIVDRQAFTEELDGCAYLKLK